MVQHTNFYETIAEATMRLNETVVLYDDEPYYVLCVTDHRNDGIFRAYLDPLVDSGEMYHRKYEVPYHYGPNESGPLMDSFLDLNQDCPIIRKMCNSPKFNKFRPFSLGMTNFNGKAYYLERSPARHTQQGLTSNMINARVCDLERTDSSSNISAVKSVYTSTVYRAIKGVFPGVEECLSKMTDKDVGNTSVSFARNFALAKGPVNILFLSYKGEIVGYLPNNNLNEVKVSEEYSYVRETIDELGIFNKIN